jgi:hypothetical protein
LVGLVKYFLGEKVRALFNSFLEQKVSVTGVQATPGAL